MSFLQTREVGNWLFDETWPDDQAHSLWTVLLQPLQQQPRRWSQDSLYTDGTHKGAADVTLKADT